MRTLLIVCIVLISTTIHAGDLTSEVSFKEFTLADFGTSQGQDLLCVKGPCLEIPSGNVRNPISSYKKPIDITHIGRAQISSPRYAYYKDKLFQVSFKIQSKAQNTEFLLADLGQVLESQYGLHLLESYSEDLSAEHAERLWVYGHNNDVLALMIWSKRRGEWLNPVVKIFDKLLIDDVRLALNPNYVGSY